MASILNNPISTFLKGMLGNIVFRHRDGKPYAAMKPNRTQKDPSAAQREIHLRFREAIQYAKTAMANPARRTVYDRAALVHRKPAFSLAVGDFFNPPDIGRINVEGYEGRVGDKIVVMAMDDIEVASLHIVIKSATGTVIEQGAAMPVFDAWSYSATTALTPGQQVTIEATARDHAGNVGTKLLPFQKAP